MKNTFKGISVVLAIISCWAALAFIFGCCLMFTTYQIDKKTCVVYVDGLLAYNGRCHYISVTPTDKYVNSKTLTIYKDKFRLKLARQYKSNLIFVEEY